MRPIVGDTAEEFVHDDAELVCLVKGCGPRCSCCGACQAGRLFLSQYLDAGCPPEQIGVGRRVVVAGGSERVVNGVGEVQGEMSAEDGQLARDGWSGVTCFHLYLFYQIRIGQGFQREALYRKQAMSGQAADRQTRRIVVVLCGIQFVDVLGVTAVITALPQLLADLNASAVQGTVVVTAYAMAFGGLLMVASRVGDRAGHRRIALASLALFAAAAALGAVAPSIWLLALARTLQGLAAAASVPAALRLLTTLTPDGEPRRRAVAGWSAAGAAAGASGFVVGGVFTELATWRSVFVVFVVLAVLLTGCVARFVPQDPNLSTNVRIAWPSGLLLTGAAMAVVAGSTLLGEPGTRVLGGSVAAVGVAATAAFIVAERRATEPLVGAAAWDSAALRWGTFGSFSNTATTSGSFTLAMLYLQDELDLAPLRAAGLLIAFSFMVVAGSTVAPRLITRTGWGGALGYGLITIGVGNALLVAWPGQAGVAVAAAVSGSGIGIGSVAATDMGTHVTESVKATAAGVLNTAAQLGTALGTAMVVLLATASANRTAWALTASLALAGGLAAARFSPKSPSDSDPERRPNAASR